MCGKTLTHEHEHADTHGHTPSIDMYDETAPLPHVAGRGVTARLSSIDPAISSTRHMSRVLRTI